MKAEPKPSGSSRKGRLIKAADKKPILVSLITFLVYSPFLEQLLKPSPFQHKKATIASRTRSSTKTNSPDQQVNLTPSLRVSPCPFYWPYLIKICLQKEIEDTSTQAESTPKKKKSKKSKAVKVEKLSLIELKENLPSPVASDPGIPIDIDAEGGSPVIPEDDSPMNLKKNLHMPLIMAPLLPSR